MKAKLNRGELKAYERVGTKPQNSAQPVLQGLDMSMAQNPLEHRHCGKTSVRNRNLHFTTCHKAKPKVPCSKDWHSFLSCLPLTGPTGATLWWTKVSEQLAEPLQWKFPLWGLSCSLRETTQSFQPHRWGMQWLSRSSCTAAISRKQKTSCMENMNKT